MNIFGKKQQATNAPSRDFARDNADLEHKYKLQIAELENTHKLALKEKEFELKHFKDDEVKGLQTTLNGANQEIAVLKKENEMLAKITNLNADIIDIKDLVASLIKKLPEINLQNLTIHGTSNNKGD